MKGEILKEIKHITEMKIILYPHKPHKVQNRCTKLVIRN
jgi:hypothetical protein